MGKRLMVATVFAAVLVVGGAALSLSGRSGIGPSVGQDAHLAEDLEEFGSATGEGVTAQELNVDLPPEHQPITMDAVTPAELIVMYQHNVLCLTNARQPPDQDACIAALVGPDEQSSFFQDYQTVARLRFQHRHFTDWDWQQEMNLEVVESSRPLDSELTVSHGEVRFVVRREYNETDGNIVSDVARLGFMRKSVVTTQTEEALEDSISSWEYPYFLNSIEVINPGETRTEMFG